MTSLAELVQQNSTHIWLFIPSAILLGALHGLEPGHSKTMMAAFIIAIRGTVAQAVLLGLAATVSHTAVVWAIALGGMHYLGGHFDAEATEPYFQAVSGLLIVMVAVWMLARTWREQKRDRIESDHHHGHGHHHGHDHDHAHDHHHSHSHDHGHHQHDHDHGAGHVHDHDEVRRVDTGHGIVELSIFEEGMPPCFRLRLEQHGHPVPSPQNDNYTVETERPDGRKQTFRFVSHSGYLQSFEEIPEPHEFTARLRISHGDHRHDYDVVFAEHEHDHGTAAVAPSGGGLPLDVTGFQDAHELAHANDIRRRFASRHVTTGQIIAFGLTGGLIPCPAAITVLLLCLQLKQLPLGALLVLCFSIGLALTMVTTGVLAALSLRYAGRKFSGFGDIVRGAPYAASGLILCMGLYILGQGIAALPAPWF